MLCVCVCVCLKAQGLTWKLNVFKPLLPCLTVAACECASTIKLHTLFWESLVDVRAEGALAAVNRQISRWFCPPKSEVVASEDGGDGGPRCVKTSFHPWLFYFLFFILFGLWKTSNLSSNNITLGALYKCFCPHTLWRDLQVNTVSGCFVKVTGALPWDALSLWVV